MFPFLKLFSTRIELSKTSIDTFDKLLNSKIVAYSRRSVLCFKNHWDFENSIRNSKMMKTIYNNGWV